MKKEHIKTIIICLITWIVLIGLGFFTSNNGSNKTEKKESATVQENTENETDVMNGNEQTAEDFLTELLAEEINEKNYSDLKIIETTGWEGDDLTGHATATGIYKVVFRNEETVWDETDLISKMFSHYVNVCRKAYENEGINGIEFNIFGDVKDSRGNVANEHVMDISMPKNTFLLYDWDNLFELNYEQIEKDCEGGLWMRNFLSENFNKKKFLYNK